MILLIAILVGAVLLDQGSKWLAVLFLSEKGAVTLVPPRILELVYTTNEGVAGGAFSGNWVATLLFPILGLAALSFYLFKFCPKQKRYRIPVAFVLAGGIGNLIDRIFRGEVVDFISMPWLPWEQFKPSFRFVDFPIFNVADICVTLGALALIVVLVIDLVLESKKAKQKKAEAKDAPEETGEESDHDAQ